MKTKIIFLLIIISLFAWYKFPYIKSYYISKYDFNSSKKYQELDALLAQWSDKYYFVKPTLFIRFNPVNQAYYSNNSITILISPDTFLYNPEYLEVAMAHEFGHHYSYIKMENLDEKMEELFADFVALKLVGLDKMKQVLENEDNHHESSGRYLSNPRRVKILEKISEQEDFLSYDL